jgi:hypothetical protein
MVGLTSPVKADTYQNMLDQQQTLSKEINTNRANIAFLQTNIQSLDSQIKENQASVGNMARTIQTNNITSSTISEILSSGSITEFIQKMMSINTIMGASNKQITILQTDKIKQSKNLQQLTDAQIQLDQQQSQMQSSLDAMQTSPIANQQGTIYIQQQANQAVQAQPGLSISEAQALANIIARESGGNPYAINGFVGGIGQLSISGPTGDYYLKYLGLSWDQVKGNYALQLQAMQDYISERYGDALNAWNWWQIHHWY